MRLLVQRLAAVSTVMRRVLALDLVDMRREIVETLGAHEEPDADPRHPGEPQHAGERGLRLVARVEMVAAAAGEIESALDGDRLEEARFATAVLAHDDRDPFREA